MGKFNRWKTDRETKEQAELFAKHLFKINTPESSFKDIVQQHQDLGSEDFNKTRKYFHEEIEYYTSYLNTQGLRTHKADMEKNYAALEKASPIFKSLKDVQYRYEEARISGEEPPVFDTENIVDLATDDDGEHYNLYKAIVGQLNNPKIVREIRLDLACKSYIPESHYSIRAAIKDEINDTLTPKENAKSPGIDEGIDLLMALYFKQKKEKSINDYCSADYIGVLISEDTRLDIDQKATMSAAMIMFLAGKVKLQESLSKQTAALKEKLKNETNSKNRQYLQEKIEESQSEMQQLANEAERDDIHTVAQRLLRTDKNNSDHALRVLEKLEPHIKRHDIFTSRLLSRVFVEKRAGYKKSLDILLDPQKVDALNEEVVKSFIQSSDEARFSLGQFYHTVKHELGANDPGVSIQETQKTIFADLGKLNAFIKGFNTYRKNTEPDKPPLNYDTLVSNNNDKMPLLRLLQKSILEAYSQNMQPSRDVLEAFKNIGISMLVRDNRYALKTKQDMFIDVIIAEKSFYSSEAGRMFQMKENGTDIYIPVENTLLNAKNKASEVFELESMTANQHSLEMFTTTVDTIFTAVGEREKSLQQHNGYSKVASKFDILGNK